MMQFDADMSRCMSHDDPVCGTLCMCMGIPMHESYVAIIIMSQ